MASGLLEEEGTGGCRGSLCWAEEIHLKETYRHPADR